MRIVHGNNMMSAADAASPSSVDGNPQKRDAVRSLPIDSDDEAGDKEPSNPSLAEEEAGYGYGV